MSAKKKDSTYQDKENEVLNIEIEKDIVSELALKKEKVAIPEGVNLTGYSGEYIFEKIKKNNTFYEDEILRKWYAPVADKTCIVFDIGANLGNHTLFFATHSPRAKLFSFEPFPPNYALLCENIENNALREQVKTFNLALGECKDERKMSIDMPGNLGTASLSGDGEISVTVEALDNLDLPLPDFIKIDVEGYELHVLRGMRRLLEKATPIIWVETSTETVGEVSSFLGVYGYHLIDVELQLNNNLLFAVDTNAVPGIDINLLAELVKKADQCRNLYWVKQELGSMTSKYTFEQHKAEELKQELGSMTSKYAYEQHKAEQLEQDNHALTESCNVYRERSVYFKKLSEKHASQFLYEQKKVKALNDRMHRYEISKPYRVWAAYQKEKAKQKHKLYSFAQKTYYKSSRYPIVLKCFSCLNKILRVFPDTSEVIFYGVPKKANEAKTVLKETEAHRSDPIKDAIPKPPRELNVAMIVDEFSYNSFRYECNAFPLDPSNWKQIFENNKIDLFFCESAWAGTDPDRRPWRGQIYASVNFPKENRTALLDILAYCKAHKIPTAFWNKEDPTHYEDRVHDFVKTALLFDHIFTSAGECVERYKHDYGHKSVHLLMFATQPRLFNPIERYDRSNAVIFAGSWYRQHPHRCEEMSAILDNILNQGLELIIYNRQSENNDPNHVFPEKFQPYVRPRLRHDQLDAAYKGSKYALNINTVTDSPTMFARRVFELMSSNTLVLSNYSEGMQKLFGDKVVFVDGEKKIDLTDSKTKRAAALEEVLSQHTYQKRFEQILRDCGIRYCDEVNDLTVIYRVGSEEEAHNCLQLFQNITWREKNAILLVAKECDGETIRNICVDYQSGNISVISEDYLERYGKALEIKTKYAVLADSTMSPDFPARAMLHWCYLPEGVGIADGGSYSIRERSDRLNIIFPKDSFSLTASEAAVYDI